MTFLYVSGAGTDSTASERVLWPRVKGATENARLRMPFKAAYMFRPGYIQPVHGARTRTKWYAIVYAVLAPLYPLWEALVPKYVTTTERLGRAMIGVARAGNPDRVLESVDINRVAGSPVARKPEGWTGNDNRWRMGAAGSESKLGSGASKCARVGLRFGLPGGF
jgi:hypothetical protein